GSSKADPLAEEDEQPQHMAAPTAALVPSATPVVPLATKTPKPAEQIGFDFTNRTPEHPTGDSTASSHIFIHKYPMPGAGSITRVIYVNDSELGQEIPEAVTLLILRPVTGGWEIMHRVTLPDDDRPPTTTGITTLTLDFPLPVETGDVFAHWQPRAAGSIPFNNDRSSIDGRSVTEVGFSFADIEEGQIITNSGFIGRRDYFINIIFEPTP
ncbi:hypothetical protein EYB53_000005, partial [Candidatus Chloroploca sp. M-50]